MGYRIGVDQGGSWLRIGRIEGPPESMSVTHIERVPSPNRWDDFVEIIKQHNNSEVTGFGIAMSGPIQDHTYVINAPNLPWLTGHDVGNELGKVLGKKAVISNDMEAATEGELAFGILRSYAWAIFDTISTGWGGNLVLNGRRVDGEPGHANIDFRLPSRCGMGHQGCLESMYSGRAMERRIKENVPDREFQSSSEVWDFFLDRVNTGTDWVDALLDDWAEGVGRAWSHTLNRIRPMQAIVYMGTTADNLLAIPSVLLRVRATMQKICMFPEHQSPDFPIVKATQANRALLGAAIVYDRLAHGWEF